MQFIRITGRLGTTEGVFRSSRFSAPKGLRLSATRGPKLRQGSGCPPHSRSSHPPAAVYFYQAPELATSFQGSFKICVPGRLPNVKNNEIPPCAKPSPRVRANTAAASSEGSRGLQNGERCAPRSAGLCLGGGGGNRASVPTRGLQRNRSPRANAASQRNGLPYSEG